MNNNTITNSKIEVDEGINKENLQIKVGSEIKMAQNNLLNIKKENKDDININNLNNESSMIKDKEKEKDKEYQLSDLLGQENEENTSTENYSTNNNEQENISSDKPKTKIDINIKKNNNRKIIEKSEESDNNSFSIFKHQDEDLLNIPKTINNERMVRNKIYKIQKQKYMIHLFLIKKQDKIYLQKIHLIIIFLKKSKIMII